MKSQILKIKAFALVVILGLSLSAFGLMETKERSFLDTHKGSLWKFGEPAEGLTIYAQINKSESDPFEIWVYNVIDECYLYEKISEAGSTEVIENRKNKVQIKIKENADEYGVFTMTINGNAMNVELDSYEKGKLVKEENFVLNRTYEKADNLVVCKN
ncbi:hypothetical protein QWY87_08905 [Lutimonas halocynthiae]|uniref:hypothetical protein n=1 Tax=Lutimonas halocynthiae TaxID=1446477 RepID=UPI0025B5868C|nr:hypothetical protein [Lutimonas halocynthiae]MDN3642815.1 hypothetical protein [Lutimonas halocynthiae]